jgi:hypothetical protein
MVTVQRLIGVLVCFTLGAAAPAGADVVTDWNLITHDTILAAGPLTPPRNIDFVMVSVAMHDAVQAIQRRFETYSNGMLPASGSEIAAAATAAHDVLVNRFPAPTTVAGLDAIYATYLQAHQLTTGDPGVAAGKQAAAAIIQMRVNDGSYPVPAPVFIGGTAPGQWRPTSFTTTSPPEPIPMTTPWFGHMRTFTVLHSSQMFAAAPPRLTSHHYTRDYNEVKALGRNVSSSRTPEQTAIAVFYSENAFLYWNRTLRSIIDRYVTNVGDSARLLALANLAAVDAAMTSWQAKTQYNLWRPITAIQLGDTDGNRATVGDSNWQPLNATPNYPDYTSGANSNSGAVTEMLKLFFRTDRVNFSVIGPGVDNVRNYTRFSDAANDVVEARILQGIHFRFADIAGRSSGQRVARWVYKYFLRSLDGDEFDFVRTLDTVEEVDADDLEDGQDEDDAE